MTDDAIKGVFVKDDILHVTHGRKAWTVKAETGKEPNQWKVVHFSDVGTGEQFIETFSGELSELVDASSIYGEDREAVKNAITTVLVEGLMPAFEHLRKIRASVTQPIPELNRRQLYEDFGRVLWHAYKDLFPKAVKLLGFDIGFLFKKDADFEKGLADFVSKSPSLILDVPELLRRQRANWQQGLADFRNDFLEHRKQEAIQFVLYYEPNTAEILFEHCWRTMAELFPTFIETHFGPTCSITEIPIEQRNPKRLRRWRFFQCDPVKRGTFAK